MKLFRIGATDYTLSRDYDKGKFAKLDRDGRVEYMRLRVAKFLLDPCAELLKISDDVQVGLIVPTILCAGISAASTFQHGRQPDKKAQETDRGFFFAFVKAYMDAALQADQGTGLTWAEWMYLHLRCGLAHAFVIESGGAERSGQYLVNSGPTGDPAINLHCLHSDFEQAWNRMLNEVVTDPTKTLATNFSKRFADIFRD